MSNFNKKEYRTFVINNRRQLIKDIKASRYNTVEQLTLPMSYIEKTPFKIPVKDIVYLDSDTKHIHIIDENVYEDYTSDIFRSLPEKRFESFCVSCGKVKWYYKNGDKGQKYFSIAYVDNFGVMNLFYPDYLLMTNDGKFFIVETKGGEDSEGESRNIDKDKVELKFNALKNYVAIHNESHPEQNIEFAFVRDVEMSDDLGNKTYQLFYDNTTWAEDMTTEWESLDKLF